VVFESAVYVGFIALIYLLSGMMHPVIILMVLVVFAVNSSTIRFCGACGAIRRQRAGSGACKRCGYDKFVSLRVALRQPFAPIA
jgi:hypothetical protein